MSERKTRTRTAWWRNTPESGPPPDDNIVQMPANWDAIEREIVAATNEVVHWEAEAAKVEAGYKRSVDRLHAARAKWAKSSLERVGGKVTFSAHPPELINESPANE